MTSLKLKRAKQQADSTPLTAPGVRLGTETIYATHNFCDPCTWYSESERVTEQALTDSGDGLTWNSGDTSWIDMSHGLVFDEEGLIEDQAIFNPGDPHGYSVVVEVSTDGGSTWDTKTQRTPFAASGGDYTVDYAAGTVTFATDQSGNDVRASYSKAATSGWIVQPLTDKALTIEKAEIQFSADVDMTSTLIMEVFGTVDIFAPELMGEPYNLPSGTPIPIETTLYKSMYQIIDESVGTFPAFPALGGSTRGTDQPTYILQFHYGAAKQMFSSLGMYIRISLSNDTKFGGERATATFYLLSKSDPGVQSALAQLLGS